MNWELNQSSLCPLFHGVLVDKGGKSCYPGNHEQKGPCPRGALGVRKRIGYGGFSDAKFLDKIAAAGFEHTGVRKLTFGIAKIYSGIKDSS
jgi:hypothetical protein